MPDSPLTDLTEARKQTAGLADQLISPHGFDGRGPVPQQVTDASKHIAHLRVGFVSRWTPGMENPLTSRELQQLFDAAAVLAEWTREVYEARDEGWQEAETEHARLVAAETAIRKHWTWGQYQFALKATDPHHRWVEEDAALDAYRERP